MEAFKKEDLEILDGGEPPEDDDPETSDQESVGEFTRYMVGKSHHGSPSPDRGGGSSHRHKSSYDKSSLQGSVERKGGP